MPDPKPVAVIVTVYFRNSHADVIVGKILEGLNYDGKDLPGLQLVSMYVDQFPERRHEPRPGEEARLPDLRDDRRGPDARAATSSAVDGVLCIGEHGNYPTNEKGQILYPRRRFFEEIDQDVRARQEVGAGLQRQAPGGDLGRREVDVRPGPRAVRPVPGRLVDAGDLAEARPDAAEGLRADRGGADRLRAVRGLRLPRAGRAAVHGRAPQGRRDRREGGHCLQGEAMWKAMDRGELSKELLEAAIRRVPAHAKGDYRELTAKAKDAGVFLIEYRDGFKAAVRDAERLGPRGRRRRRSASPARSRARTSRGRATSTCSSPTRSPTSPTWSRRSTR